MASFQFTYAERQSAQKASGGRALGLASLLLAMAAAYAAGFAVPIGIPALWSSKPAAPVEVEALAPVETHAQIQAPPLELRGRI